MNEEEQSLRNELRKDCLYFTTIVHKTFYIVHHIRRNIVSLIYNEDYTKSKFRINCIAVITSGVNVYHSHIDQQITGKFFRVNRHKYIEISSDIRDLLGHRTAITAVIRYMAKDANIVVVRMFKDELTNERV